MALVPTVKDNDWNSVRQAIQKLASIKLGPTSAPTFNTITITSTAIISVISTTSATVSSFSAVSATISSLAITSLSGISFVSGIPIVTALYPSTEGDTVYLNNSSNTLFVYREA